MTDVLEFNTGREYSAVGQIITATFYPNGYKDMQDFWDKGLDDFDNSDPDLDPYIIFEDHTRGIKGKITLCPFTQESIMRSYDMGLYINLGAPDYSA